MLDPARILRAVTLSVVAVSAAAAFAPGAIAGDPGPQWTIVDTYSIPEGASGLAFDGTWLYCGIYGADGGRIYRIDPSNGSTTLLFTGVHEDAFGLTYDGQYLWTTDHTGSSSTPAVAMQLDWDGSVLDQFNLPDHYMSGIAYDNGEFWVPRYFPDPGHLYRLDSSGAILDQFDAPDDQPWDLWVGDGVIWLADYWGDTLYKLDAATGAVLESHPSEGVDPAGIVWDGTHVWYCDNGDGFQNDFLYRVDPSGIGTPGIDLPVSSHDFGTVAVGDTAIWNMTVNNTGDAELLVEAIDFGPSRDLSSTALFPVAVPAGETAMVPIVYAPSGFGPLDAVAAVVSNDPVHPEEPLTLTGHGVFPNPAIGLSAAAHDYGVVRVGAYTRWLLEITNQGSVTLTIDDIAIDNDRFYVDGSVSLPIELGTLATVEIGLWFNPAATAPQAATVEVHSNDPALDPALVDLSGSGDDSPQPIGQSLWSHLIDEGFDNSPKAIASIEDVSGDGVPDVIVCSEDNFVRCFNGNAHASGDVLWAHEIFSGNVYAQHGLQVVEDLDGDGQQDLVVGVTGGARLIRAISGQTGTEIWSHQTNEYGGGGWVYQVDCRYDYNGDGVVDALASTGDDGQGTGPRRVYCLDGLSGLSIWERPLSGPVFAVIGVEDFTGDGQPDVVAGASNASETQGTAFGLDGADSTVEWAFPVAGSSVWGLGQLGDVTLDGVNDVIIGDFTGNVYGLDATNGAQLYSLGGFGLLTRLERLDDVNGDGHPDFVPTHLGTFARAVSGRTGAALWTVNLADKPAVAGRIPDVNGDGVNDLVAGTLFSSNFWYFLDGTSGATLASGNYGTPVDAIVAIPDVTGDGSWEMVAGGRNGLVTCVSGGTAVDVDPADVNGDGVVNVEDLVLLVLAWGPNPGSPADINGDGVVNVSDLVLLILAWSP